MAKSVNIVNSRRPDAGEQKLFAGARVRRLRRERGLTQAQMAADLGISASYLNLIERNQRPVTAQTLVRLASAYDVDLKGFAGTEEARTIAGLVEALSDPLFRNHSVDRAEIREVASAHPEFGEALVALYQAYRETTIQASELAERLAAQDHASPAGTVRSAAEEVRDFLERHGNHFPALEATAETLGERARLAHPDVFAGLRAYLSAAHATGCHIVPASVAPGALRWYDRHRRRIYLSEMLSEAGRTFQLAAGLALIEHGQAIDAIADGASWSSPEARRLCRVGLAGYLAAAVMMPYQRFLAACEDTRYDIAVLCRRFGASFEQVCHRLTTLQRPGARGIPFFMIRIDNAGNVSKRFSGGAFPFARVGGACPRWNVHAAFLSPGRLLTQVVQMPDGARHFTLARTVARAGIADAGPDGLLAIGLGCEIAYAARLAYADAAAIGRPEADTPIGVTCRLCERADCAQRAFPPLRRRLLVDEHRREAAPIGFAAD